MAKAVNIARSHRLDGIGEYYFSRRLREIAEIEAATGRQIVKLAMGSPDLPPHQSVIDRLAKEVLPQGKIVQFMATTICMCSTMQRIDPQHLAWTLENLADGKVVNRITVPEHEATLARIALQRMLAVS